jgi:hypothetical protein
LHLHLRRKLLLRGAAAAVRFCDGVFQALLLQQRRALLLQLSAQRPDLFLQPLALCVSSSGRKIQE